MFPDRSDYFGEYGVLLLIKTMARNFETKPKDSIISRKQLAPRTVEAAAMFFLHVPVAGSLIFHGYIFVCLHSILPGHKTALSTNINPAEE